NLLFVLGMAMLAGGYRHKKQIFNQTGAMASSSTLLLAVIALVMPAIFVQTAPAATDGVVGTLSIFVSLCMIAVYIASLFFILVTHKHLYTESVGKLEAKWKLRSSIIILLCATGAVAWMSEILVRS